MANNSVNEDTEIVMVEDTKPDPHTYEFLIIGPDNKVTQETVIGFLYVTSAFVGVGVGDGEVKYVVPLERILRVKQIEGMGKPVGNA